MKRPETIEGVLAELDRILETALEEKNAAAIFAYVYRRTTAAIKKGIEDGVFVDNKRMRHFDVQFANLYIEAWHGYRNGESISRSWHVAFDAAKENRLIAQHMILGMNAHINLDLGHAAALIMEDEDLEDLRTDFMKVNDILFSLTNELQRGLGKVSRGLFLADWMGRRSDELFINFSIKKARDFSWITATRIWGAPDAEDRDHLLWETDTAVTALAEQMRRPKGWWLNGMLALIRCFEEKDVRKIVAGMQTI